MREQIPVISLVAAAISLVLSICLLAGMIRPFDWRSDNDDLLKTTIQFSSGTKIGISQLELNALLKNLDEQVTYHQLKGTLSSASLASLKKLGDDGQIVASAWKDDFGNSCKDIIESIRKISPSLDGDAIFFVGKEVKEIDRDMECRSEIKSVMRALDFTDAQIFEILLPQMALKKQAISMLLTKLSQDAEVAQNALTGAKATKAESNVDTSAPVEPSIKNDSNAK